MEFLVLRDDDNCPAFLSDQLLGERERFPKTKKNRVPRSEDNRRNPGNFRIQYNSGIIVEQSIMVCTMAMTEIDWAFKEHTNFLAQETRKA